MTEQVQIPEQFVASVKQNQCVWGLQDQDGEGWVVCDSSEFENTDVMPIWSNQALALSHCTEEWQGYQAVEIALEDFLEYWVEDLNEDGVLVGLDWQEEQPCLEVDPIVLAKQLVDIETL
ncbi:DUF2750 domain-containing protein [Shewanella marina]|uniref:DUF2750 domain-containing protein n=1 Tax=Shewanella marina TaxID=487319 RepID=UPI0004714C22|nr:DUF2750 domain-containing protein [Shewanella marina]